MKTDFPVCDGRIRLKCRSRQSIRSVSRQLEQGSLPLLGPVPFATGLGMVVRGDNDAIACAKTFRRARLRFHSLDFPSTRLRIRH